MTGGTELEAFERIANGTVALSGYCFLPVIVRATTAGVAPTGKLIVVPCSDIDLPD